MFNELETIPGSLHTFLPITKNKEVNTWIYINEFRPTSQRIAISRTDFARHEMTHYLFIGTEHIRENKMGIPEPISGQRVSVEEIDVVFVPLLGCDKLGNRVGYGKGYYDQFLSSLKKDIPRVGLCFFEPLNIVFEDVEEHDIPLTHCITPEKVYRF
jgi:5-formyltetrahydrofolate cyclo-ligase